MASNDANQPLLSGLETPKSKKINGNGVKKRRLRRVQSAPFADVGPTDTKCEDSLPRSESIFGRLNPSLKKVALFLTLNIGLGTICFYLIRNQIKGDKTNGFLDAVYFCVVTMTTVGYGDLVPNSDLAKLLACSFVFTGMALIGFLLSKAADYLAEKQEVLLVKALYLNQQVGEQEVLKEIENNKVKYKFYTTLILLVVLISSGTIFLHEVENLDMMMHSTVFVLQSQHWDTEIKAFQPKGVVFLLCFGYWLALSARLSFFSTLLRYIQRTDKEQW